jgi:hypothetical protein
MYGFKRMVGLTVSKPDLQSTYGISKMLFQGVWSSLNQAYQKKQDKQDHDKAMVYTLSRSLLSAQLNALLEVDDGFRECPDDDPLMLLEVIKRLISTSADGNEELDRQKALGEWLTLTMKHGEKIPENKHPKP